MLIALSTSTGAYGASTNRKPVISGTPPTSVTVGQTYSFTPTASDPDGNALSFSIKARPAWASFSTSTGQLSGAPGTANVGTYSNIVISVSDGQLSAALPTFSIVVSQTNRAPVISGTPPTTVTTGQPYSFTPTASDPDGDQLSFSVTGKPAWANFNPASGQLSGTPTEADVGVTTLIVITVSDGQTESALAAFSIDVSHDLTNHAPTIAGYPLANMLVDQEYSFVPTAADADGDPLLFSIQNKPAWASFSTSTGQLSGTPATADVGTDSNIVISVSDGQLDAALPAFSIVVSQTNRAPVISGTPPMAVTTGQNYSFTPTASDPDGNALSFSIVNKPPWASFSTSTGQLSGTPGTASVGEYISIEIAVTDGTASASLPAFSIVVSQANRAPVISGTPTTAATVGQNYSFTPAASDPDGDELTFSIAGKPDWANFNPTSGQLSGTPTEADVGMTPSIVITVSDGQVSTPMSAFAIQVQSAGAATCSATLSWTPPTERTNGSPLTNLAGYRIHYGTASTSYDHLVDVNNPGIASYVVEGLVIATWYFAVTAYDSGGLTSAYSNEAFRQISDFCGN